MKFIIENYTSNEDTQAMYFHKKLNTEEHQCALWDSKKISLYDIMDSFNPNFFITHAYKISKELVHYLNNTDSKAKVLLSVNSVPKNTIVAMEKTLIDNKVPCDFFFGSHESVPVKKIRYVKINNCYDENIITSEKVINYSIDKGIFINSREQIKPENGSYHFLSNDQDLKPIVDICLPEIQMSSLYKNYNTIIFKNIDEYVPQAFFDAIISCDKVYYETDKDHVHEMIQKIFKPSKSLNFNDEDKLEDFSELKSKISEKHGISNRVKTLLSQLSKE
jgi:hypothetical protein